MGVNIPLKPNDWIWNKTPFNNYNLSEIYILMMTQGQPSQAKVGVD